MAEPIIWIRWSNTLVLSASKDFQWTRHLNMVYAATGFPSLNPRFWLTQFVRASMYSCSIGNVQCGLENDILTCSLSKYLVD